MGLFTLGAESIGDDPLPAERALWDEIRRIQNEPIDPQDLERLKTRIETRRLFGQEEVMGMARTLSAYQQLGDYHLADTLVARLRAVTPADVQRVAREYLQVERASLLEYLPADSDAAALPCPAGSRLTGAVDGRDGQWRQSPMIADARNSPLRSCLRVRACRNRKNWRFPAAADCCIKRGATCRLWP